MPSRERLTCLDRFIRRIDGIDDDLKLVVLEKANRFRQKPLRIREENERAGMAVPGLDAELRDRCDAPTRAA